MMIMCVCVFILFFFFFKQKTAYEMRISDWSSDVCSSDLRLVECTPGFLDQFIDLCPGNDQRRREQHGIVGRAQDQPIAQRHIAAQRANLAALTEKPALGLVRHQLQCANHTRDTHLAHRSEEHTSELQSLMRNSYSVFC